MANAKTTGFKAEGVFQRQLIEAKNNLNNVPGDVEQEDAMSTYYTDYANGGLEKTGNKLDLALGDAGFFVLRTDEGKEVLTRAGNFMLSETGVVTSPDGSMLMTDSGPLAVNDAAGIDYYANPEKPLEIKITEAGEIFVNSNQLGKLLVVTVDDPQQLKRLSGSAFEVGENARTRQLSEQDITVKQGYLEKSNVNVIEEMVNMIGLQRNFEYGQKVIQTNDRTLDKSMDIGRVV